MIDAGERPTAFEVELTPKAPARLRAIVKAWRRARHVGRVVYFCTPGATERAVVAAVRAMRADERIEVRPLESL